MGRRGARRPRLGACVRTSAAIGWVRLTCKIRRTRCGERPMLASGTRLGPYQIVAPLRPGGMGLVKMLDFGRERVQLPCAGELEAGPCLPGHTEPGVVLGTVGYMSPEQLRGQAVDGRSDLFSLGCVLYELVAGQRPFRGKTAAETTAAILHDEPARLRGPGVGVPAAAQRRPT